MSKKTVMVTGATSGIGLNLFHQYADNDYNVIACGRNTTVLQELKSKAYQCLNFDLQNQSEVTAIKHEVTELDILIINAGTCEYIDDVIHFDSDKFSRVISTNLTSVGWLLSAFLSKVKTGGQVVFISSSATILPFPRNEAYGASKAGIDYLANSLRLDLKSKNIDVTLIHPGFVKTPLTDKNTFNMPFLMSSKAAAIRIFNAVHKRKKYHQFPKRLTYLLRVFACLPSSLWEYLILKGQK